MNWYIINKEYVKYLHQQDKRVEKYRKFKSLKEKQQYIELLDIELKIINRNESKIIENARKSYNLVIKYPMSRLAKRSCNFKMLELKANEYEKEK